MDSLGLSIIQSTALVLMPVHGAQVVAGQGLPSPPYWTVTSHPTMALKFLRIKLYRGVCGSTRPTSSVARDIMQYCPGGASHTNDQDLNALDPFYRPVTRPARYQQADGRAVQMFEQRWWPGRSRHTEYLTHVLLFSRG